MAKQPDILELVIEEQRPDEIPLVRLGEYMADYAQLGTTRRVHIAGIEARSAAFRRRSIATSCTR